MNHILIIKKTDNSFEKYYNDTFQEIGCTIISEKIFCKNTKKRSVVSKRISIFYKVLSMKKEHFFDDYDMVIIFEDIITAISIGLLTNKRVILWYWNTIFQNRYYIKMAKKICEVWTFDSRDADKYSLKLNTQFYTKKDSIYSSGEKKKAFFIGVDKGRLDDLIRIHSMLKKFKIESDFHVIPDDGKKYINFESNFVDNIYMDYKDVLKHISECMIIVDLVKEGQIGLTVRILEGLNFKKKVITNNKEVLNCPFYNVNNFFVLGIDPEEQFEKFIESPFVEYSDADIKYYSAKKWINRFR